MGLLYSALQNQQLYTTLWIETLLNLRYIFIITIIFPLLT